MQLGEATGIIPPVCSRRALPARSSAIPDPVVSSVDFRWMSSACLLFMFHLFYVWPFYCQSCFSFSSTDRVVPRRSSASPHDDMITTRDERGVFCGALTFATTPSAVYSHCAECELPKPLLPLLLEHLNFFFAFQNKKKACVTSCLLYICGPC